MKQLLLTIIFFLLTCFNVLDSIYLDSNNVLQDIVIFIKDDVPNDNGELIERIKENIKSASYSLWRATSNLDPERSGVRFGNISIVIPRTWKNKVSNYITWQQCSKAEILITTDKENNNKDEPFTKQIGKCGEPGNFTRFPVSFFARDKNTFTQGKKVMKEFVKLRYGVFSEKPDKRKLVIRKGNSYIQSSCGKDIQWELSRNESYCSRNYCEYNINPNQNHNYSVMFDEISTSSEFFCNENNRPHNNLASSLQNKNCNRRSISNVILQHSDFNRKLIQQNYSNPSFTILSGRNRRLVLVLDVSVSMSWVIDKMKRSVVEFINQTVEDTAELGLASFSFFGRIVSHLKKMNNSQNKNDLMHAVNSLMAGGWTNIPDGLRKGIQILGGNMNNSDPLYGTIFLLTDGQNNQETNNWNINTINRIIAKGLIVNTISYGNYVDNLIRSLAEGSGGIYLYANPTLSYTNLMGIFASRSSCESVINSTIKIIDGKRDFCLRNRIEILELFFADRYIGKDLFLSLTYSANFNNYSITLISPSSKIYTSSDRSIQRGLTTIYFKVIGIIETGFYKLKFSSTILSNDFKNSTESIPINYIVSAKPNENSTRDIYPTGQVSSAEIERVTDKSTINVIVDLSSAGIVINETVSIRMTMIYPNTLTLERHLLDDGLACDSIAGDFIFTACIYPRELTQINFYTFTAEVNISNNNDKSIIRRSVAIGNTRVKEISNNIRDTIPPARIDNLTLTVSDAKKRILKINCLATGDNGIIGNISQYNIKIKSFIVSIFNLTIESSPLQPISFTINLFNETTNDPFTVSIRGVDNNGNEGDWSMEQYFGWNYDDKGTSRKKAIRLINGNHHGHLIDDDDLVHHDDFEDNDDLVHHDDFEEDDDLVDDDNSIF